MTLEIPQIQKEDKGNFIIENFLKKEKMQQIKKALKAIKINIYTF